MFLVHDLHWGFMHDAKYAFMCGDQLPPRELLAVFGVTVGKSGGGGNVREFCVAGAGSWMVGGGGDGLGQFGDVVDDEVMSWFLAPVFRSKLFHYNLALARAVRYDAHHSAGEAAASAMIGHCFMTRNGFTDDNVLSLVATMSADDEVYSRFKEMG